MVKQNMEHSEGKNTENFLAMLDLLSNYHIVLLKIKHTSKEQLIISVILFKVRHFNYSV
jgi:hypothetical protein